MEEEKNMYCPICSKQIEKYGRRKDDLSMPGWVFCPKHGWIQESGHKNEVVSEKESKPSEEKFPEVQQEQEKSLEEKGTEIPPEKETPEALLIPEEEQLKADSSSETELKTADLYTKWTGVEKNKPTVIAVVTAIFCMILIVFLLGYFFWKKPTNESLEIKSSKAVVKVETSDKQIQSQAFALSKNVVSQSEITETEKKTKEKSPQPLKPSKAIFTVQVAAFSNASYAEALREKLSGKEYDAYITTSESKKGEKLYKVYIGKFNSREKAESLCEEIRKTEGLETFVTQKDEI